MEIILPVVGLAGALILIEAIWPGREWPRVSGWLLRAVALNSFQLISVFIVGVTWDLWMPGLSLWDAGELGVLSGSVIGYLGITFVYYWWHRARHESHFLWRWLHQIHHSPQRIEIITSFYKHPLEIITNGFISSAVLYVLMGLNVAQASAAVAISGIAELFYHWNIRTPYWIGYFFQRPESHCVHHMKHHHRQNYSDLPLWDILFGTFNNPTQFSGECGFEPPEEKNIIKMIIGNEPSQARRLIPNE